MEITDKQDPSQSMDTKGTFARPTVSKMMETGGYDSTQINDVVEQPQVSKASHVAGEKGMQAKLPIKFTPQLKILLTILGILFLMIFILMLLPKKSIDITQEPTPIATVLATPSPELRISEFAQTEIFKLFEQQIASVAAELNETDLREDQLTFPLLDMNINFEK